MEVMKKACQILFLIWIFKFRVYRPRLYNYESAITEFYVINLIDSKIFTKIHHALKNP